MDSLRLPGHSQEQEHFPLHNMPATLQLLPRKEFIITLESGQEITGQFGTWQLSRFGLKRGYSLAQIGERFGNGPSLSDIIDFILSAVEYSHRKLKDKTPFEYTDIDCSDWIDQLGGIDSELFTSLLNHNNTKDEKKSDEILTPTEQS